MVEIIVKQNVSWARLERSPRPLQALSELVSELGGTVQWLHEDSADAEMSSYLTVTIPAKQDARHAVERLLRLPGVEAAYLKPADEVP